MRSVPRIPKARRFVQTESGAESSRETGAGNLACRAWRRRIPFRSASFRQKLPKWWTQKVSPVVRIFPSTKLLGEKRSSGRFSVLGASSSARSRIFGRTMSSESSGVQENSAVS